MNASVKKASRRDGQTTQKADSPRMESDVPKKTAGTSVKMSPTRAKAAPAAAVKESDAPKTRTKAAKADKADKTEQPVASKASAVTKTSKAAAAAESARILTEDEIRAMSDKDYMNEAQLAFFKARLQQLERDLLKNAGETTEHLRETVLVPDPADRATIEEEHALELRTRDRERKLLKKVQQSLAAIDNNDYGWCEETGEPIGVARLIARPTATLSLEAQQRRELKQKLYGD
jgi:DnaK suppressor protein